MIIFLLAEEVGGEGARSGAYEGGWVWDERELLKVGWGWEQNILDYRRRDKNSS